MDTNRKSFDHNKKPIRYGMFIPLALMIASVISCFWSYNNARQDITDDLNDAMIALANENRHLWACQDTIVALRHLHETTHQPLIYQAADANFRNTVLKDKAYFTLVLADKKNAMPVIHGHKIISDSIIIVPDSAVDGLAIQVQGFTDCSIASVFAVSDQTLPGVFLTLSLLSMVIMMLGKKEETDQSVPEAPLPAQRFSLPVGIKLTPMQRQLTQMLLDAPEKRVDKHTLCAALWGNKSNAEESLYTLVRRTKTALGNSNIEIICNRGESYEIRITS